MRRRVVTAVDANDSGGWGDRGCHATLSSRNDGVDEADCGRIKRSGGCQRDRDSRGYLEIVARDACSVRVSGCSHGRVRHRSVVRRLVRILVVRNQSSK
jgi:hypothetical protein